MNVDWDTNWAPTIVTVAASIGLMLLQGWLRRKWGKGKPLSEELESTYEEGSTRRFRSVKTWSRTRRKYESTADGGLKVSEETINFESEQGTSTVSTKGIQDIWKGSNLNCP